MKVRLQKFLAEAGVASRRASEQIIVAGRVAVNGRTADELGTQIDPQHDRVTLDGRPLKAKRKLYLALHKPRGYLCTRRPEKTDTRNLIFNLIPKEWDNLFSVGRLDYYSEGLIFLTNDGDFALKLTHPRFGVSKTYVATIAGRLEPSFLQRLIEGVDDHGEKLQAKKARLVSSSNRRSIVEIELTEGKNREVRRMFESQDLTVDRLQRIKIGRIKLGELPEGKWRALTESEIKSLLPKL